MQERINRVCLVGGARSLECHSGFSQPIHAERAGHRSASSCEKAESIRKGR